jgi:uncharacterized protein
MNDKVTTVHCPTCGAKVIWGPQSPFRPFCSERCRLIDLGEWVEGTNRAIPGQETPFSDELGEPPTEKN